LSVESRHTLVAQGGAMTDADVVGFTRLRHFDDAIRLRRADDAAKVVGRAVPGLDQWVPILRALYGSAG
jgi:predicted HD phosphohydrolase